MIFEDCAPHRRRQRRDMVALVMLQFRNGSRGIPAKSRGFAGASRIGRRSRCSLGRARHSPGSGARHLVDACDYRADGNIVAFLRKLLGHDAGHGRRNFDAHLVGFEIGDRLVGGDRLAGLFQPLREGSFGDRFPECGDFNVSGHLFPLFRGDRAGLLSGRPAAACRVVSQRCRDQRRLFGRMRPLSNLSCVHSGACLGSRRFEERGARLAR